MITILNIIQILVWIVFGLIVVLALFIFLSVIWANIIIKHRTKKIKETRKELLKIALQDVSFFIQISLAFGIAVLLFSLSLKEGVQMMSWGLFGLICAATGIFLLFWKYMPLRNKLYSRYK